MSGLQACVMAYIVWAGPVDLKGALELSKWPSSD